MSEIGNDGLTDEERSFYANRWLKSAGNKPTKEEMKELRRLTPVEAADELTRLTEEMGLYDN